MTPVFKKGDTTDKSNYRPISTLSNFSKIFEKLIYSHVNSYMEPKLSKFLAGFCRNHNTQHALLRMIESWRVLLNKSQKVGGIIMDLSKTFDTLNHKLLLKKKLHAYGFDKKSVFSLKAILQTENKALIALVNTIESLQKYHKALGTALFQYFF